MRVSPEIENLIPYKPGKPISETQRELGIDYVCKLASNENPLGVSPKVKSALEAALSRLHRYPDPSCTEVREALAKKWSVSSDNILMGNGSNELIDLMIRVFCEPGDGILCPQTSFIAYSICAQAARVSVDTLPLDESYKLDIEQSVQILNNVDTQKKRILFLANPNNPTGVAMNSGEVRKILDATKDLKDFIVVLDEAYNEFVRLDGYPDSMALLKEYPQLVVMRTFSKVFGLAGLRAGALIGPKKVLDYIHRVRNPFNVNQLAQAAVVACLDDEAYLEASQKCIWQGLDNFYAFFQKYNLPFIESHANFVLFNTLRDGGEFYDSCLRKGLILRPMGGYKLPTYMRMSVGTFEENKYAMEVLPKALSEVSPL